MVKSINDNFDVKIINKTTKDKMPEIFTPEGYYIIAQRDVSFEVKMLCKNKNEVYGAKLFIDGQEASKFKTFKESGLFFGFADNENYKSFIFQSSDRFGGDNNILVTDKIKKDIGHIKVSYYLLFLLIIIVDLNCVFSNFF